MNTSRTVHLCVVLEPLMFGLIYPCNKEGVPVQGCKKQVSKLSHLLIVTWTVKELPAVMEPLGSLPCFQDYYGYKFDVILTVHRR